MLTIGDVQIQAFREARWKHFASIVENRVRVFRERGEISIELTEIPTQVQAGIRDAGRFGLSSEQDIAGYVVTVCRHFGGFPAKIPKPGLFLLYGPGVPSEVRVRRFEEWSEQRRREER